MKTGIIILVIFVALFIVEDAISQQVTYSGTVEYKHTRTKTANGNGSEGINWNVKVDEKYIVEGTFYVTFTGGVSSSGAAMFQFTGINEKINFIHTVDNEAKEERISQSCYDGLMRVTHTVSPGDSRIHKLQLESEQLEPTKPCITGGFLVVQCPPSSNKKGRCKYSIMLMGNIKANVTSALYTEETFPCNEENSKPANLFTNTVKMDFPIAINLEEDFDITDEILEGKSIITDIHHTKCNACLGSTPTKMVRGDLKCAYDENLTVSWTLVKRSKECDANLSNVKGDVKINGVSMKEGNTKISAGDIISTGDNSRMQINMPSGNEAIRLGSNSRFIVKDPCNLTPPREIMEPHKKGYNLLKGKVFQAMKVPQKFKLERKDFNNEEDWANYRAMHTGYFHTAVAGVRGQISPPAREYYCSNDYNIKVKGGSNFDLQYIKETDPEKESMINEFGDLKNYKTAFYVHTEPEAIYDVSAIKGDILVESAIGTNKMAVKEGLTVTSWPDGSQFIDIYISAK